MPTLHEPGAVDWVFQPSSVIQIGFAPSPWRLHHLVHLAVAGEHVAADAALLVAVVEARAVDEAGGVGVHGDGVEGALGRRARRGPR